MKLSDKDIQYTNPISKLRLFGKSGFILNCTYHSITLSRLSILRICSTITEMTRLYRTQFADLIFPSRVKLDIHTYLHDNMKCIHKYYK